MRRVVGRADWDGPTRVNGGRGGVACGRTTERTDRAGPSFVARSVDAPERSQRAALCIWSAFLVVRPISRFSVRSRRRVVQRRPNANKARSVAPHTRLSYRGRRGGAPAALSITPSEGKLTPDRAESDGRMPSDDFFASLYTRRPGLGAPTRAFTSVDDATKAAVSERQPSEKQTGQSGRQHVVVVDNRPPTGARLIPVDRSWTSPVRSLITGRCHYSASPIYR